MEGRNEVVCAVNELIGDGDTVLASGKVLVLDEAGIVCEGWSCKHMTDEVFEDVSAVDRVGVTWVGSGGSIVSVVKEVCKG